MMSDYLFGLGIGAIIVIIFALLFVEVVAIVLIAGAITSWLGFSGLLWWVVAIGLFLIINGIIGAILWVKDMKDYS